MSNTSNAGIGFLRLLIRLVLGGAFFFAGWHACFQEVPFTPEEIRMLEGVPVAPIEVALRAAPPAAPAPESAQEAPSAPAKPEAVTAAAEAEPAKASQATASPLPPIGPFAGTATVNRPAAERLALDLQRAGIHDFAEPLAWAAAAASLVGGALVVIGLLTRFWALTMAVMLGGSFWFVSVVDAGLFDRNPFQWWATDQEAAKAMFSTAAFFTLSVTLLITGPGGLSIDRIIWPAARTPSEPVPDAHAAA